MNNLDRLISGLERKLLKKTDTIECHLHPDEIELCVYVKYLQGVLYRKYSIGQITTD